jgi:hypothetical protein
MVSEGGLDTLPESAIRRFLLGLASEQETLRVEEEILRGGLDLTSLQFAEDDLIDDYHFSRLNAVEREGYKSSFLVNSERREKHAFVAALSDYANKRPAMVGQRDANRSGETKPVSGLSWKVLAGMATAAALMFAVLAMWEHQRWSQEAQIATTAQDEVARVRIGIASNSQNATNHGIQSGPGPGEASAEVSQVQVVEFSSQRRNTAADSFQIQPRVRLVQLELKLPETVQAHYRATLLSASGSLIWSAEFLGSPLQPSTRISVTVPSNILIPGVYHLQIQAESRGLPFRDVSDRVFRVAPSK